MTVRLALIRPRSGPPPNRELAQMSHLALFHPLCPQDGVLWPHCYQPEGPQ